MNNKKPYLSPRTEVLSLLSESDTMQHLYVASGTAGYIPVGGYIAD